MEFPVMACITVPETPRPAPATTAMATLGSRSIKSTFRSVRSRGWAERRSPRGGSQVASRRPGVRSATPMQQAARAVHTSARTAPSRYSPLRRRRAW